MRTVVYYNLGTFVSECSGAGRKERNRLETSAQSDGRGVNVASINWSRDET